MIRKLLVSVLMSVWISTAWAVPIGDDGLHKPDWLEETFLDLQEDLAEAQKQDRRLMLIVEQRGCIYCTRLHEKVFTDPEVDSYIRENFFVVQLNMFGDLEVVDFDGTALPEKEMVSRWGLLFTPTLMFMPPSVEGEINAAQAAVATVPGAFGKHTVLNMLTWVKEQQYLTDEPFQKYHARRLSEKGVIE